jgi:hypothetical protein
MLARLTATAGGFLRNLRLCLRLVLFLPVQRERFRFGGGQVVLMLGLTMLAQVGCQFVAVGGLFWSYGLGNLGTVYLAALFGCWLAARIAGPADAVAAVAVLFFGADFWLSLVQTALDMTFAPISGRLGAFLIAGWYWLGLAWYLAAAIRAVRIATGMRGVRAVLLGGIVLAGGVLPQVTIFPVRLWYQPPAEAAETAPAINVEDTFGAQDGLVRQALDSVAPSRGGTGDLYFVGFAGFAQQDVFLKEARSAQALFDARFGTRGRSLLLVNNPATVAALPIASVSNLAAALRGIGHKMDAERDVLFLYLTSHGSQGELAVRFPPLLLNGLTPDRLHDMLDEAGIRWRVIAISACYSGSFIPALEDGHTLVMTAASADRTSFGCSNENDFTYFGDALIGHALQRDRSFVGAFRSAADAIGEREKREGLVPSQPQIFIGDAIQDKLAGLERRLDQGQP